MIGYHYHPMLWATLGSAAFISAIAAYLWRRRADTKGASTLALVALLLVAWCLAGAAESAATEFATQRAWFVFRDALTLPGVILGLWFALLYAGLERWLIRPVAAVLVAAVIAHVSLEVIDGGRLLWSSIQSSREIMGERTGLGLVFAAFVIAIFLLSTAVFLVLFVRSPAHRVPVALILMGQVALRIMYPLVVFNVAYVPSIVTGVLGFDALAAMYAIALFRFRLFDLVPVARQTILQHMPDAMLVLDAKGRVADFNLAARRFLGTPSEAFVGTRLRGTVRMPLGLVSAAAGPPHQTSDAALETDEGARICQVTTTDLTDWQGAPIGRLVQIHDITELRAVEERLLGQERALTAARERERLGRDLHDSLGQVLGYVGLQAATIRKLAIDGRLADVDERLARVAAIAAGAQSDVRRTIAELGRSPQVGGDFLATLRDRLDACQRDYGIATSLALAGPMDDTRVPPEMAAHLLRIVDEAVANAIRHGRARAARVSLERTDGFLSLSVEDDGVGFEAAPVLAGCDGRYGLRFMRERAEELGGQFELTSSPGHGARVTVRIPLETDRRVAP